MEQNELNAATHWVIETGRDCDGSHTRGRVWPFLSLEAAEEYAQKCAEWSDGLGYSVINIRTMLKEYCYDHQLFAEEYYYVSSNLNQIKMEDNLIRIWTYFTGTEEEVLDYAEEWYTEFGIDVLVEKDNAKDSRDDGKSWYCEAFVTQEQIEEFNLLSDWIESN